MITVRTRRKIGMTQQQYNGTKEANFILGLGQNFLDFIDKYSLTDKCENSFLYGKMSKAVYDKDYEEWIPTKNQTLADMPSTTGSSEFVVFPSSTGSVFFGYNNDSELYYSKSNYNILLSHRPEAFDIYCDNDIYGFCEILIAVAGVAVIRISFRKRC